MTGTKNDPITIALPAYLVDMQAAWARADTEVMRPIGGHSDKQKANNERLELADAFVRAAQLHLPALSAEGDLADALNEREEVFDVPANPELKGPRHADD